MPKLIINKRCFFYVTIFIILVVIGIWSIGDCDDDLGLSVAVTVIGFMGSFGYIFIFPNGYRFDEKSITVYYGFGLKTVATWSELMSIEDHHSTNGLCPWLREYHIRYFKTKFAPWQEACIPKNRKTTAWIEKYYKKTIHKFG